MAFVIEITKNGKPNILYKNKKYRESYAIKSGNIVWRCLGRTCGATIKTDADKTTIIESINKHTGHHPVTMRTLSSPLTSPKTPSVAASVGSPAAESASRHVAAYATPHTSLTPETPTAVSTPHQPTTTAVLSSTPSNLHIVEENMKLKHEIKVLEQRCEVILNHSIQSDTRLLEFTNELFPENYPAVTNCNKEIITLDFGVQCDLSTDCHNPSCVQNVDLIGRLKTSIEVLEAEIICLKSEISRQTQSSDVCIGSQGHAWTEIGKKNRPVKTTNKFEILTPIEKTAMTENNKTTFSEQPKANKKSRKQGKNKNKITKNNFKAKSNVKTVKNFNTENPPSPDIFTSICIESDSHGRHIAGLLQSLVPSTIKVNGICKPGAKLLDVTSGSPPPPGSCSIVIAGTNDVVEGEQKTIFKHLEHCLTDRLRTSNVIVSTLPHRHDLSPDHPVNKQVLTVNAYIEELCKRYSGLIFFNINLIGRRFFTGHGLHLSIKGKHLLAKLLLRAIIQAGRVKSSPPTTQRDSAAPTEGGMTRHRSTHAAVQSPPEASAVPVVLPYETFADAVKVSSTISRTSSLTSNDNSVFLEKINQHVDFPARG